VVGGVERRWSTVGLYQVRDGRVAGCWLLPLDPATFDDILADRTSELGGLDGNAAVSDREIGCFRP